MRLSAEWVSDAAAQSLCAAFTARAHQIFFVGGCVRNTLMSRQATDIDLATSATPEQMLQLGHDAELKTVPTGFDHGTVTFVIAGRPFEVTSFRADVETDGRHAVVQYSKSIEQDAARRDLTMNALYAAPDGTVVDPLGGLPDVKARRVRFIGDAGQRICEDYLRALRFFRFFAWYGDPSEGLDADGLAAVACHLDGLGTLSKERVTSEVLKLLGAPEPVMAVAAMRHSGVLGQVLPGGMDTALGPFVHHAQSLGLSIDPVARLAALGDAGLADHLRLSKAQARRLMLYRGFAEDTSTLGHIAYAHGAAVAGQCAALRAALLEVPLPQDTQAQIAVGAGAQFPLTAADLLPRFQGKALGDALRARQARWIASGFTLGKDDLLP